MIKTMFAFGALALAAAVPAAAQDAAGGSTPMCSATVHDSCQQGPNNPRAMTAEQAMASGGVGDRKTDKSDFMAPAMPGKHMMHKHKMMHHKMTKPDETSVGHNSDPTDAKPN